MSDESRGRQAVQVGPGRGLPMTGEFLKEFQSLAPLPSACFFRSRSIGRAGGAR